MSDNFWSTYFATKAAYESLEYEKYLRENNLTRREDKKLRRDAKIRRCIAEIEKHTTNRKGSQFPIEQVAKPAPINKVDIQKIMQNKSIPKIYRYCLFCELSWRQRFYYCPKGTLIYLAIAFGFGCLVGLMIVSFLWR